MPEELFFEDIQVGDKGTTAGRTVTEADIVNFAGLSGDYNPIHVDAAFARGTLFQKRLAHGLLVLAMASGLYTQCEMNLRSKANLIAAMDIQWRFLKPVFIGDTIHVAVEVVEKRETRKPDRGIVIQKRTVVNQQGEAVQEGLVTSMFRRRP